MKAKDLTQADVGKWVTLRAQITNVLDGRPYAQIEGTIHDIALPFNTILEFTDPPTPVQEVGDVFRMWSATQEWTLSAIVSDVCLLTGPVENGQTNGMRSERYPLPSVFTLVRKGTQS